LIPTLIGKGVETLSDRSAWIGRNVCEKQRFVKLRRLITR